jgi:hypothetical protein
VTAPLPGVELNRAAIQAALAALHEGRSTGNATLDQVVDALGRCRARAWARFRRAWPDVTEAEIDFAADRAVEALASVPAVVVMLVIADAAKCADAGGVS